MGGNDGDPADSSTYQYPPPQQRDSDAEAAARYTAPVTVIVSVLLVIALFRLARCILGSRKEQQEPAVGRGPDAAGGDDGDTAAGAPNVREVAVAVEMKPGPVVCAYRRADGWQEATCPVCLSDFADGETVRVLPACMHYFHAACVDEWLCAHTTCPLCRAAPPPPSPPGTPAAKATATSTA